MKLNFVLVLCALFAYSKGMELSHSSQISIRSILYTHIGLTIPDSFMTDVHGLAGTFRDLNKDGSSEMAKALVQAYKNKELTHEEILGLIMKAVILGKFEAYFYFAHNIKYYSSSNLIFVAAKYGHVDILDSEYVIDVERFNYFKAACGGLLGEVVRNGHYHILRWFAEKGLMKCNDAAESLFLAIEKNNQELIEFLLTRSIYIDFNYPEEQFTFKECLIKGQFGHRAMIFDKATEVENIFVVKHFLDQNILVTISELIKELHTAVEKNRPEIAKLIADFIINFIQQRGENGTFYMFNPIYVLNLALETNYQNIIDLILREKIFQDPNDSNNRLDYEQIYVNDQFFDHKEVVIKAAEVRNTDVVQYFLSRKFVTDQKTLKKVKSIASKNNLTEIFELIDTMQMF